MAKIIVAGGTGNLGTKLIEGFLANGDEVYVLSRQKRRTENPKLNFVLWDGEHMDSWTSILEGADTLINLSGASINRVFNEENKSLLRESRVRPTSVLGKAIQQASNPPRLWINASGVSIFNGKGDLKDEESTDFGSDFLANLAKDWEAACLKWEAPKTHQVILRIAPVLMAESGMFAELYPLAKLGLAGTVGSGKQIVSWILLDDFLRLIPWIISLNEPDPVYHACSPNPLSNEEFMKTIRTVAGSSIGLPLPSFMAKIGARVKGVDPTLLLETVPVTTKLTLERGFKFNFPYLQPALQQLILKST